MAAIALDGFDKCFRDLFTYTKNKTKQDKKELLEIAADVFYSTKTDGTKLYLPGEMWEIIFSISHCVDTCQTHLAFKKPRVYNRDTYYIFSGTPFQFAKAIERLDEEHNEEDENDDLPIDHFCSGVCEEGINKKTNNSAVCPMNQGRICSTIWKIFEFDTERELKIFEYLIPHNYCFHGFFEVKNLIDFSIYAGMSAGDSWHTLSKKGFDKGPTKICVCAQEFYLSDKHYFNEDTQRYFCSVKCLEKA